MANPTSTTMRTDDRPVEKLAQCKLMKLIPWLDWSRDTCSDSSVTSVSTETEASSSAWMAGGALVAVYTFFLSHSLISNEALLADIFNDGFHDDEDGTQ